MLNKFASFVMALVVVFVSFASNVEAAKNSKVKIDHFIAILVAEPEIEESESSTTIKTKAIVNDKKVLIVEKISTYTVEGSGVWIAGFKVAGGNQKTIGYHHFRMVDMETGLITYVRSWQVDNKGNVKTDGKSIPEVTYVVSNEK